MHEKDLIKRLEQVDSRINNRSAVLSNNANALTGYMLTCPMPAWVKDLDGRMMFCNYAYEEHFGISPVVYNDRLDSNFWSKKESKDFRRNDQAVHESRKAMTFVERIFNEKQQCHMDLTVKKWPVTIGGYLLGIAGQVIHERVIDLKSIK